MEGLMRKPVRISSSSLQCFMFEYRHGQDHHEPFCVIFDSSTWLDECHVFEPNTNVLMTPPDTFLLCGVVHWKNRGERGHHTHGAGPRCFW
jgi:hypothetical protein